MLRHKHHCSAAFAFDYTIFSLKEWYCRDPGFFRTAASSPDMNQGPSDLQSDALPTELPRQR